MNTAPEYVEPDVYRRMNDGKEEFTSRWDELIVAASLPGDLVRDPGALGLLMTPLERGLSFDVSGLAVTHQ